VKVSNQLQRNHDSKVMVQCRLFMLVVNLDAYNVEEDLFGENTWTLSPQIFFLQLVKKLKKFEAEL